MSNTVTTAILAACYILVDRCAAWGIVPFWPALLLALAIAFLLGWYIKKMLWARRSDL